MAHAQTQALRLCDVLQAVREAAANEQETLATVVHLLTSGQVRLSDDAIKAIRAAVGTHARGRVGPSRELAHAAIIRCDDVV